MPKFPEPPDQSLLAWPPPRLRMVRAGTVLWRIYFRGGRHPTRWDGFRFFGPVSSARIDHHLPPPSLQARGVLYAAREIATCLAEVFQEARVIDTADRDPWLVGFALLADVAALDLTGTWPTAAGASMALNNGRRDRARRWSQAIYAAYPQAGGLWYPSSIHANRPAMALYERSQSAVGGNPIFHRALADAVLLAPLRQVGADLGYELI